MIEELSIKKFNLYFCMERCNNNKITDSYLSFIIFMKILDQKKLTPSLVIPKPVKIFSKSLEIISPYLATRFSAFLFSTPISYKRPKRESYMYQSAQKSKLKIHSINKEIELLSYGYSPKRVLLIHGWAGRSTQLFAFADKLLEKGYMIISFDGPAHGKSTGKNTNMLEFIETTKQIQMEHGPFEAVIGHSFGASSSLISATSFLDAKTIISIGSANKVSEIMQRFTKSLTMSKKAGKRLQNHAERKWKLKVDSFSASEAAKKIEQPVLVVHDVKDGDVPVSCAFEIRQNLKNGKLFLTHGLGHTKILRNKDVVNKAVEFIIENT